MNINEVISRKEYSFLQNEERLKNKICFLTFGGSISYGLNTPESDIDIRGIVMPSPEDLLGASFIISTEEQKNGNLIFGKNGFEQLTDIATDTTIYTLDKIVRLLYRCNPNVIEMLGCKPEHYACVSKWGKMILDNREVFLSKLAYDSFAGYARGQFQRLKNALGNGSNDNVSNVISLADSINRMQGHLERSYPGYKREMLQLFLTDREGNPVMINGKATSAYDVSLLFNNGIATVTVDGKAIPNDEVQLRISLNIEKLTTSQFSSITNEINTSLKEFTKHIGHRNNKKDDYHLCKHAMHLVRLYLIAEDILRKGEIITYREKEHDFLLTIKNGHYMNKDNRSFSNDFFDLIGKYEIRLEKALEESKLPAIPAAKKINRLLVDTQWGYLNEVMPLKN